ncbi:N-acetylmuramoyl-L-alanine amidase [Anaerovorax sp. IOR16]|uniref:N-acetylmuramoyl-L-alanine amidase n=1 Tax=Anaerovorax sp. IOR16 TaxID=2773458 RepID=UPI0019D22914|nr:N-acetylmuramoyl-L-alanine amidase [Anaerovorax sp. IOR16]
MKQSRRNSLLRMTIQLLLLISLLLLSTMISFAIGSPDGSDHRLTIDGNLIQTSVPPYIENDRSLVPARAVFEAIGANVTWSPSDPNHVGISYANTQVSLTLNSPIAYVNGEEKKLDVPARLHNNSTMIPVRFVSESLSFGVGYDVDQRIIQLTSPKVEPIYGSVSKVSYEDLQYFYRVEIDATEPIKIYQDSTLADPNRYILDLTGFTLDASINEKLVPSDETNNEVFSAIRSSQFTPDTVRVVVDLKDKQTGAITLSPDEKNIYIDFSKPYIDNNNDTSDPIEIPSDPINPVNKKPANLNEVLIVIDPGHGGNDPGAQGKSNGAVILNEKDINLDVATRLNEKLQAAGLNTIMSRNGDHSASPNSKNALEDRIYRSNWANSENATLFVSIHNNSAGNVTSATGTETFYNETEGKAAYGISSKELAASVQKKMTAYLGTRNRGVKNGSELSVLRRTEMPAILMEGAFLSNPDDLQLMLTDTFRENYANAVSEAIIEYLNEMYQN